jgi:hypothetical protein
MQDIIEKLKALKPEPYSVCQYEGDCACESERGIVLTEAERDALLALVERKVEAMDVLREVIEGLYKVWSHPEDCDECGALSETGSGLVCALHGERATRLYHATYAAEELLGPCVRCGHARHDHHDEDSTACRACRDCTSFRLPDAPPSPRPAPSSETPEPRA